MTKDLVINNKNLNNKAQNESQSKQSILLIDEVDVFFSEEFYGKVYRPCCLWQDQLITSIQQSIWDNSITNSTQQQFEDIQKLSEYKQLIKNNDKLEEFINQQIKLMIDGAASARKPEKLRQYKINQEEQIGYIEQDHYSYDISFGYTTIFTYFFENQKGNISDQKLQEISGINLICGKLSYALLAKQYQQIFGLTGTYKCLHDKSKQFLNNYFEEICIVPSLFQEQKTPKYFQIFSSEEQQFLAIQSLIKVNPIRPVLIFFKDDTTLQAFYNKMGFTKADLNKRYVILQQNTNLQHLDNAIMLATHQGMITLIDRTFGRGTDFICDNSDIDSKGGMIAIQTFFSLDKAEQVQIMGRVGRQERNGEYYEYLNAEELKTNYDINVNLDDISSVNALKQLEDQLNTIKQQKYGSQLDSLSQQIKDTQKLHQQTQIYLENLKHNQKDQALKFFSQLNLVQLSGKSNNNYQFIFLLDESGSMNSYDGTQLTRWQQLQQATSAFISTRRQMTSFQGNKDLISIIYYESNARVISDKEQLDNVEQKINQTEPKWGGTNFYNGIKEIKNVIAEKLNIIVLFLSDGGDSESEELIKELEQLKANYGQRISRWWNIGFGPSAQSSAMMRMVEIMKSDKCDAQFKKSLEANELIEYFAALADDQKLNF